MSARKATVSNGGFMDDAQRLRVHGSTHGHKQQMSKSGDSDAQMFSQSCVMVQKCTRQNFMFELTDLNSKIRILTFRTVVFFRKKNRINFQKNK